MPEATIPDSVEWRVIVGFPDYSISEFGDVKRITPDRRGRFNPHRILKTKPYDRFGHRHLHLVNPDGKRIFKSIHQLVLRTFVGPPPTAHHQGAHKDGVAWHNHVSNLKWATCTENQRDRKAHGTDSCGPRNGRAVLSSNQVLSLKRRINAGESPSALARECGTSKSTMYRLKHNIGWAAELNETS